MSEFFSEEEIIVDLFAGGGGTSTGIEMALGFGPHYACNHDPVALAMHAANHPNTIHLSKDVWKLDPLKEVRPGPIGLLWMSPDCRHFSKAKGGAPATASVRDLAWVGVRWAKARKPRIIMLENVEEFVTWGPLLKDGRPNPKRKGETFRKFVRKLEALGYVVEWGEGRACDDGAPTIRNRLCLIARCDGEPIVWPKPTHAAPDGLDVAAKIAKPWRTAADIIDWSLPCPSIFMTKEEADEYYRLTGIRVNRPLAENTMARIAKGVMRYVINNARPFIVPVTHQGDQRVHSIDEPIRTITTAKRGELALVSPTLISMGYGERPGQSPRVHDLHKPLTTVVAGGNKHALVAAFLAQHNGGMVGHKADRPLSTLTGRGTQQQLVAASLINLKGSDRRMSPVDEPCPTICAGGQHVAAVEAFLVKYFGTAVGQAVDDPLHTETTKPRFGLVMVHGEPHQIVDIGMRMLTPRERFSAQGFPPSYKIDIDYQGKKISAEAQGRLCGNSVSPPWAAARVKANFVPRRPPMDIAA